MQLPDSYYMPTIHWIIGQSRIPSLMAFMAGKIIEFLNQSVETSQDPTPPSGYGSPLAGQKVTIEKKRTIRTNLPYHADLWLPFSSQFFDNTTAKLEKVIENIGKKETKYHHSLVVSENSMYFCDWYHKDDIHPIIESMNFRQILWYCGTIFEAEQILSTNHILKIPRAHLPIVVVTENWESYTTHSSEDKAEQYQIKTINLDSRYRQFYELWKVHRTSIEEHIKNTGNIRLFLLWEEFKYDIQNQSIELFKQ